MIKVCKHLLNNLHYCLKVWSRTDFYMFWKESLCPTKCYLIKNTYKNLIFEIWLFYSMFFHFIPSLEKSGVCNIFERSLLYWSRLHLFDNKCSKVIMWNIITISNCCLFEYIVISNCSCEANLYFQHHYPSLQCLMILQKSFSYADLLLKKHFFLL